MAGKLMKLLRFGQECGKSSMFPCRQFSVTASLKSIDNVKPKTGILMLNMGGPSHLEEVEQYLARIMTDTNMIQLPIQRYLGPYIAWRRTLSVQAKYAEIGGKSPLLDWTNKQGKLMCEELDRLSPESAPHKYYIAFRYANPLTESALQKIEEDGVEHTVIFSQYPQYSCATSGSSFIEIYNHYINRQMPTNMKWSVIDRWSGHPLFIQTIVERIKEELVKFPEDIRDEVIILFSAHSLPMETIFRGDDYAGEVAGTVLLVMEKLQYSNPYKLVWQSQVGPAEWMRPNTDDAITSYVKQGKKHFLLVPVAFVNEHIETLHELDIEFCEQLAESLGIDKIRRCAAPNDHPTFISALANIVISHLKSKKPISPMLLTRCPFCQNQNCEDSKNWYAEICKK